jgi:signal transduction histidine kinase
VVRHWDLGIPYMATALITTIVAALVNLVLLRVTLRPELCAHVAVGLLTAMLCFSTHATGGFYDVNFAWLYLIPICAAVVLDVRGAAIWTGIAIVISVAFWLLPELGYAVESRIPLDERAGMALFSRVTALVAIGLVGVAFVMGQRRAEQELGVANADLFRETAYVQLLMHAAVSANEATSFEVAMQDTVDRICHTMGWEVGHVCVVSDEGVLVSSGFIYASDLARFGALRDFTLSTVHWPGEGLPGRALASGLPQCIVDLARAEGLSDRASVAEEAGLRSAFAIPVPVHGEVRAVLEFAASEPVARSERLMDVFAHIGRQLGRVAERSVLQDRLRQSQKLEAVGQLAAGLAHEINNPMSYVRSNLHVLRQEWESLRPKVEAGVEGAEFEDFQALIDESLEGVDRTIAIVKDVREFSHFGGGAGPGVETVDLAELVDGAIRVAAARSGPDVDFERAYGPSPRVVCHANQLRQVLVNLIVNAVQAVGQSGRIRLVTGHEGPEAYVRVEDDGPGMSEETRERLFDPFFTTKPVGEGTGLGLYVSYEIVKSHGGNIVVHAEPGVGSSFEVRLPVGGPDGRAGTADDQPGDPPESV